MDGDIDFSNSDVFGNPIVCDDLPSISSDDSFWNNMFEDAQHHACTHTHTCNPPGPDLSHTHTCYHVHTKIVSAPSDETAESLEKGSPTKKRPCGNREAVRKYREKKKARAASLEDEVVQLRQINQQLMKKLQNQAALEAEVARLRCLLVDLRGRIEGEIGPFPYYKPMKGGADLVSNVNQGSMIGGAQVLSSCGFRCDDQACLRPTFQGKNVGQAGSFTNQVFGVCDVVNMQCMGNLTSGSDIATPINCPPNTQKIEGHELSGHKRFVGSDASNQG